MSRFYQHSQLLKHNNKILILSQETLEKNKKQIDQTQDIFIKSYQPFLTIEKIENHFPEHNNKYTISMKVKNTGRFPAIISSIFFVIENDQNYDSKFSKIKYIIFPSDTKTISPTFDNIKESLLHKSNITINITLNYNGIDNKKSKTIMSYKLDDTKKDKWKEHSCNWKFSMND